jgi:hypothetical protein
LEKSMHSSRAAFSSLQTQHGYGERSDEVVRKLVWSVVSGTFAFAAASPFGLRSAARLLVPVVVDDAGNGQKVAVASRVTHKDIRRDMLRGCELMKRQKVVCDWNCSSTLMMPFVVRRRQLSAASERHRSRVMGGLSRNGAPRPRSSEPRPINT